MYRSSPIKSAPLLYWLAGVVCGFYMGESKCAQAATPTVELPPIRLSLVALSNNQTNAIQHRWHRSSLQLTIESASDYRKFGRSIAVADIDGDGFTDLLVGQPRLTTSKGSGAVFIFPGVETGLFAPMASVIESGRRQSMFGAALADAGDVNGDGLPDVVIGAPYYSNGERYEGAFFLLHGKRARKTYQPEFRIESDHASVQLGFAVASAGDVNGDGFGDVLVGAPRNAIKSRQEGTVFFYPGSPTGLVAGATWTCEGHQYEARCGQSVLAADLNRDGYSDVVVGMPDFDTDEIDAGRVSIFFGSRSGLRNKPDLNLDGPHAKARFGAASAIDDLNGDDYVDLLIGAPGPDGASNLSGWVFAYLGGSNGLASVPIWTISDHHPGAQFGATIAGPGDVTGDRYPDVLIGAPHYGGTLANQGRVYLFVGAALGMHTTPDWILEGGQAGALCGESIAAASDLNRDGLGDFVVGAPDYTTRKAKEGRVDVFLGSQTAYLRQNEFPVDRTNSSTLSRQPFYPLVQKTEQPGPGLPTNVIYIGSGGILLALAVAFIYWRRRSRAALRDERQRLARDLHDDLGAKLTSISVLTELVKRDGAASDEGRQNAQLLIQTAQEVLGSMEQVIWSVNPANDTLDNLVLFIVQYAGPYLAPSGIELVPQSPTTLPSRPLPANLRKNVFLSVKEALNNVVKHAEATQVDLRITYDAPVLVIAIEDNGQRPGRINNAAPILKSISSDGLRNMHERMDEAGGTFTIDHPPGGGTRVTLRVRV